MDNVIKFETPEARLQEEEKLIASYKPESNLKNFLVTLGFIGLALLVVFLVAFFLGNLLIVP